MLDTILLALSPLKRLEDLVAQLVTTSPFLTWLVLRRGQVFAGFPPAVWYLLVAMLMAYSFVFSMRRLRRAPCFSGNSKARLHC